MQAYNIIYIKFAKVDQSTLFVTNFPGGTMKSQQTTLSLVFGLSSLHVHFEPEVCPNSRLCIV